MLLSEAKQEYQTMIGDVPESVAALASPVWWVPAECPERNGWMIVRSGGNAPKVCDGICTITNPNGTPTLFRNLDEVVCALREIGQYRIELNLAPKP